MKTALKSIAALLLLASAAACNTIEGAGEDISSIGNAASETARDVKDGSSEPEG